jgi:hypothetical protein
VGFTIGSTGKVPGKTCQKRRGGNNSNNSNNNNNNNNNNNSRCLPDPNLKT